MSYVWQKKNKKDHKQKLLVKLPNLSKSKTTIQQSLFLLTFVDFL